MDSKIYDLVKSNWELFHQSNTKYDVNLEFMDNKMINIIR
jgi:hypothetical protein